MKTSSYNALVAVMLVVCAAVYLPGLQGDFIYDDFSSLLLASAFNETETVTLGRVLAEHTSGPTGRPLSMATFYLSYKLAGGFDAASFKAAGLAIHLANGLLLYLLFRQLLQSQSLDRRIVHAYAVFITAIWLLHPLHVSTVLYVVQRMTLLATTFMLLGLLAYIAGRERIAEDRPHGYQMLVLSVVCMATATLSKEIGALQGILALVIECFILKPVTNNRQRRAILAYFGATIIVPGIAVGLAVLGGLTNPFSYAGRPFTLAERLMTESRVLFEYMRWVAIPDIRQYGLFHDDIVLSRSLTAPPTTILAVLSLALIGIGALLLRRRWPLIAGGVVFFLAGHGLESTALPLLLAFEHRNYLPSAGLIMGIVTVQMHLTRHIDRNWLSTSLACLLVALLALATVTRTINWGNPLAHALSEVRNHPRSPQAHSQASTVYSSIAAMPSLEVAETRLYATKALQHLETASDLDPTSPTYRINILRLRSIHISPPDRTEIVSLTTFLKNTPTHEAAIGWQIQALINCGIIQHQCRITHDDLRAIAQSALENHRLSGRNRASVLIGLATIENSEGNVQGVIDAYEKAIRATRFKIPYRLALADYLINLEMHAQAADVLSAINRDDQAGRYRTDISSLRNRLSRVP